MNPCLFCRIAQREVPSNIVYEDDQVVAFEDINPQAPFHVLIVPRRHAQSVQELEQTDRPLLGHLMLTGAKLARDKGVADSGYRLVVNTGAHGGQTVFHLHLHVLGGRPMRWPPG